MGRPAKHPVQEFNRVKYYKKREGYYQANFRLSRRVRYMHRDVWEFHHGAILDGFEIHHRDHDKSNNAISNLELVDGAEHASYHGKWRAKENPALAKAHMALLRPLAAKWHKSKEGRAWHSEHGKRTWNGRESKKYECIKCGKQYEALAGTRKKGYCSAACQSASRRASGVDDEQRKCEICHSPFSINKYAKTKTCSKGCWRIAVGNAKRGKSL